MDTETLHKRPCRADSVSHRQEAVIESSENSSGREISQPQELINKTATVEEKTFVVQKETERP
jgi:hypothetical protein